MKKAIKELWHGIKAVITVLVNWITTLFGMNDNSKYSRLLRRVVGTSFAIFSLIICVSLTIEFFKHYCENPRHSYDDDVYFYKRLSDNAIYYRGYCGEKGYITDGHDFKTLKSVAWIAEPMVGDSLACYSDGKGRGYFNINTGRMVIKPSYNHAWIFSEGLAAVERDKRISFINSNGETVIDRSFTYMEEDDGYVFHNGYCAVRDSAGKKMGFIDHRGEWTMLPEYENIVPADSFWIATKEHQQTVLSFALETIIPLTDAKFNIQGNDIVATLADHTLCLYSNRGELKTQSLISDCYKLTYETDDLIYSLNKSENIDDEYRENESPQPRIAVATCGMYEAEKGWYGLMSQDGRFITPPSYSKITAKGKDLYLCVNEHGIGVLLNSKGMSVK